MPTLRDPSRANGLKLPKIRRRQLRGLGGTALLGSFVLLSGAGAYRLQHGLPLLPEGLVRRLGGGPGTGLAANPRCRELRASAEGAGTRHFYVCSRDTGATYKDDELVTASPPTPTPTPAWVAQCEVDTPSEIINAGGLNSTNTVEHYNAANIGGPGIGAQFNPGNSVMKWSLNGTTGKWTNATGLVMTIENPEPVPGRYQLNVDSTGGGQNWDFIMAPNETKTVSMELFPDTIRYLPQYRWSGPVLHYLGDPAYTPLKRNFGGTNVNSVFAVQITRSADYPGWSNSLRIRSLKKDCRPFNSFFGSMDEFGQLTGRGDFPGKVHSEAELRADASLPQDGSFPTGPVNQYLTPTSNPIVGAADGKWKFAKVAGRWTLVDPEGRRTKLAGVNSIDGFGGPSGTLSEIANYRDGNPATNLAKLYTGLPDPAGIVSDSYRSILGKNGYNSSHFDAAEANVARKYGTSDYASLHADRSAKRLRSWGMNVVVNAPQQVIASGQLRTVEWYGLSNAGGFRSLNTGYSNLADPFDSAFAAKAFQMGQSLTAKYAAHPELHVGAYSDNESEWGNEQDANYKYSIPKSVLRQDTGSPAKVAFRDQLIAKYSNNVSSLNAAWGTSYSSFDGLFTSTNDTGTPGGGSAKAQDMDAFNLLYARKYFQTVKQQLAASGYQGLYLGVRFRGNGYTDAAVQGCADYCDAVSVNIYTHNPGASNPIFRTLDKPVIISEYSLSTADGNGKQSGGFENPVSVAAERSLMDAYYDELKSWNNVVGTQWWQYMDESPSGRFSDGENLGFGLVSMTDRPYVSTTDSLKANLVKMETVW